MKHLYLKLNNCFKMSIKPTKIVQWAVNSANETRQNQPNKVEPSPELKSNGSLDGNLALNNFNWMMNTLGLWSEFLNDVFKTSNGSGVGLTTNDHFSFIVASDKTDLSKYIVAIAFKSGASAPSVRTLQNQILTLGTPNIDGTIPINGGVIGNIVSFSLNFKIS